MSQMCDFGGKWWYVTIDSAPAGRESEPAFVKLRHGPGTPMEARADEEKGPSEGYVIGGPCRYIRMSAFPSKADIRGRQSNVS